MLHKNINIFLKYAGANLILAGIIFYFTKDIKKPNTKCTKSFLSTRLFGVIPLRDALATLILGAILGKIIENSPFKGILIEFLVAPFIHYITGTKTMVNHKLFGGPAPNGTGHIPLAPKCK